MSLDDHPERAVFATEGEWRHLAYGRWLWLTGRISDACAGPIRPVTLPPPLEPSFPIVERPRYVGDGWSDEG